MAEIELTDKQSMCFVSAYNHIMVYNSLLKLGYPANKIKDQRFLFLTGFAGTGKSTVIKELYKKLSKPQESFTMGTFTSFTGRACQNLVNQGVPCFTSHSLFYEPVLDEKGNLSYFKLMDASSIKDNIGDFLVIEEASMMNEDVIDAIIEKTDCPIIFVGDDAQLPCINGRSVYEKLFEDKVFESSRIMIMEDILRTGEDSQIDVFADKVRRTGKLDLTMVNNKDIFADNKKKLNVSWFRQNWKNWDVIICGTNRTRKKFNTIIRVACGFNGELPEQGERVMCVENTVINDEKLNNGELFEVIAVYPGNDLSNFMIQKVEADGTRLNNKTITVTVENEFWSEEQSSDKYMGDRTIQKFVFGYAISAFKMQGSSAPSVIFYDEDVSFFLDQKAFRYTSVTRASSKLLVAK